HFQVGDQTLTLVSVHLYYGGQDARSIAQRQHELVRLRDAIERVKRASPGSDVVLLGDFNLALTESTYAGEVVAEQAYWPRENIRIPSEFLDQTPRMAGIVAESTTVGRSNYDHIFFFEDNDSRL